MRCMNALDSKGRPEWLQLIHEINRLAPESIGRPTETGDWWAGGTYEEYDEFRVVHRTDDTTSVVGKTPQANALIETAAANLGL